MKRFKEGDILTLEDVKNSFHEIKNNIAIPINESGIKPVVKDGVMFFDSIEEAEKYFGGQFKSLDEVFKC